jgi:uncharacterized GH25 family protein
MNLIMPVFTPPGGNASPVAPITRRILLFHTNAISGQVVDDESKAPVKGLRVMTSLIIYRGGRRVTSTAMSATTDEEGQFSITGLPAGEHCVHIEAQAGLNERLTLEPTKEQIEKTSVGYAATFWPKASDLETATLFPLSSGMETNVGTIRLSREPLYSALLSMGGPSCKAGDKINLSVRPASSDATARAIPFTRPIDSRDVTCDHPVLVSGLPPGHYGVRAWVLGRQQDQREYLSDSFDIVDRNLTLNLLLARGVDVSGKVVLLADSLKSNITRVQVILDGGPTFVSPSGAVEQGVVVSPDSEGNFKLVNTWFQDYSLMVMGLTPPLYVKSISYNGKALQGGTFTPNRAFDSHSIEIVLDDKPASVSGQVADRDGPLKARVMLIAWPPHTPGAPSPSNWTYTDDQGRFSFRTVAPGEYRIFAVAAGDDAKLERPGVMEQLAKDAMKLELSPNNTRNLTLEPLRP